MKTEQKHEDVETRVDGVPSDRPMGSTASNNEPITTAWLQLVGFKKAWMADQQTPHWLLWVGDSREFMTGTDDLGIELAAGKFDEKWFCWFRSDVSRSRGRFVHVRYLRFQRELVHLVEAITGVAWNPERHEYGSLRYPGQRLDKHQTADAVDPSAQLSGTPTPRV